MLVHKLLLLIFLTLFASAVPFDSQTTNTQLIVFEPTDPQRTVSAPGSPQQCDSEYTEVELASDGVCSKWLELYGHRRWTYTEVRWCLQQTGSATVLFQEQANSSYFWGGAWYGGGRKTLAWRTYGHWTAYDEREEHRFDSGHVSNDGPAKKPLVEIKPELPSGKQYGVSIHYYQTGPYWEGKASMRVLLTFGERL